MKMREYLTHPGEEEELPRTHFIQGHKIDLT